MLVTVLGTSDIRLNKTKPLPSLCLYSDKKASGSFLVEQWIRICLPVWETWVHIPGPGRCHMSWGRKSCAPQPLKPTCPRAHKP